MKSQAPARYIFLLMKLPDGSSFFGHTPAKEPSHRSGERGVSHL